MLCSLVVQCSIQSKQPSSPTSIFWRFPRSKSPQSLPLLQGQSKPITPLPNPRSSAPASGLPQFHTRITVHTSGPTILLYLIPGHSPNFSSLEAINDGGPVALAHILPPPGTRQRPRPPFTVFCCEVPEGGTGVYVMGCSGVVSLFLIPFCNAADLLFFCSYIAEYKYYFHLFVIRRYVARESLLDQTCTAVPFLVSFHWIVRSSDNTSAILCEQLN